MSLETEITRVIGSTKDALKTLITKLGGTVGDELIDQYSDLAGAATKPDKWDKGVLLDGGALKDVNGKDVHADVKAALDIPAANDAKLTIQKNGTKVGTFSANASADKTVNITVPTQASDIGAASSAELKEIGITLANKAPGGFGLGDMGRLLTPEDNLDEVKVNGWYLWQRGKEPKGTLPVSVGQSTYATCVRVWGNGAVCYQECVNMTDDGLGGCLCVRTIYGSTIFPWEWVNPPMELGVEYRTTERYMGRSVYKKLVALGEAPSTKGTKEIFPFGEDYNAGTYNVFSVDAHISNSQSDGEWTITMPHFDIGGGLVTDIRFSGKRIDFYSSGTTGYYGFVLLKYTKLNE